MTTAEISLGSTLRSAGAVLLRLLQRFPNGIPLGKKAQATPTVLPSLVAFILEDREELKLGEALLRAAVEKGLGIPFSAVKISDRRALMTGPLEGEFVAIVFCGEFADNEVESTSSSSTAEVFQTTALTKIVQDQSQKRVFWETLKQVRGPIAANK